MTILVGVLLVVRSDQLATRVGSWAGRAARKVLRQIDPDAWVRACVDFRGQIATRFRYGFPRSLVGLFGMLATDLVMLVLAFASWACRRGTCHWWTSPSPTCSPIR